MQNHLIQDEGEAVAFNITLLDRHHYTLKPMVSKFEGNRTCFLIKIGKNSNKADAQGESWEEILSAETPCLRRL